MRLDTHSTDYEECLRESVEKRVLEILPARMKALEREKSQSEKKRKKKGLMPGIIMEFFNECWNLYVENPSKIKDEYRGIIANRFDLEVKIWWMLSRVYGLVRKSSRETKTKSEEFLVDEENE